MYLSETVLAGWKENLTKRKKNSLMQMQQTTFLFHH